MRRVYLSILAFLCLISAGSTLGLAQIVSDDFNSYNLKTSIWTLTDPLRDATFRLNGTGTSDATLSISVPAGSNHELWTDGYNVPRIMQAAPNTDFDVEVKFESLVTKAYQSQGVIVEQDSLNLVRIEFNSAGADMNLFVATFTNGFASPIVQMNTDIGTPTQPLWLRIHRASSTWVLTYSTDGSNWTSGGFFVYTMAVHRIGLFAGNAGGDQAPAHTAVFDYFFNSASPISPEDSGTPTDTTPPLIYDVAVVPVSTGLLVNWKTDEPSTGSVSYGKTLSYEGGTQNASGTDITHSVNITGLTEGTLYNVRISANDNHPNNSTNSSNFTVTTLVSPTISVWYGNTQTFGTIGVPQHNADILGNVTAQSRIDSLSYTLNGGAPQRLSVGPDGHLLQMPGDFKINLPYAELQSGANTVEILAIDSAGMRKTATVTVNHHTGAVWPLPYSVSWLGANSLSDSVQVVDGKWERTPQGVHTVQTGYDRAIAIGDTTWKNYEVSVDFIVNEIDSTAQAFSPSNGGPALGLIFRWVGHTTQPEFVPPITQPLTGYLPLGAFAVYSWRKGYASTNVNEWALFGNDLAQLDTNASPAHALAYGTKYTFKMQVSSIGGELPYYRFKYWATGTTEPSTWLLAGQQTKDDPQHGSVLLVAHYVDVYVGRVAITPLQNDAIPPQIGPIEVSPGAHTAFISFPTDELARARVLFGPSTAYGDTATNTTFSVNQGVQLEGLTPSTLYHFQVIAFDTAGNQTAYHDSTFTTKAAPPAFTFVSDEFNEPALDTTVWKFVNPNPPGGGSYSKQPTTVSIHVPAGTAHDIWSTGYSAPRLMQNVNNTDFSIDIRFDSPLSTQFQAQGLTIEQDDSNFIRLDFDGNGTQTRMFAATFTGGLGNPVVVVDSLIGGSGTVPLFMRIKRLDDGFTYSYSLNGTSWITVATFHHSITVHKIGFFASNAGANPPAFDAIVDYIRSGPVGTEAKVNLKVILEGAYVSAGDSMRTQLRSVMPMSQPYDSLPWNYPGSESVGSIPASTVDWVLVELRSDSTAASKVARRAGLLMRDGHVVDVDGSTPLMFPSLATGNYYIVVYHRNHLAIMSAAKVHVDTSSTLYDFTTGQNKAFGNNAMKALGTKFGLYAGDANMDGQVTSLDFDQFNPLFRSALKGYQVVDWNMDGQVTSLDFDLFNPNFRSAAVSKVPK